MIQRKTRLMDICEEIAAPFTTDQEGKLRGGFGGFGGGISVKGIDPKCGNGNCKNDPCSNEGCQNGICTNGSNCSNAGCTNTNCNNCTSTTAPEQPGTSTTTDCPCKVQPSGFLLF